MTGITRSTAAKLMAGYFGTSAVHVGGTYDTYTVEDTVGRKWKVVSDSSIQCQSRGERTASRQYSVEVVSPICRYEDLETIQQVVRTLRRGGAKVNESCGIHIHVDASAHDSKTLRNIVNIMASKEDLLYKALKVQVDRQYYCQKADLRFLEDINGKRPKSMQELETLWYNGASRRSNHYDSTRYHALNLHSVFSKGTISPIQEHSRKPEEARDKNVALMGDVPRVELFARQSPPGWDVWGNEVESTIPDFWTKCPEVAGPERSD